MLIGECDVAGERVAEIVQQFGPVDRRPEGQVGRSAPLRP
jgi:hypothetical protein